MTSSGPWRPPARGEHADPDVKNAAGTGSAGRNSAGLNPAGTNSAGSDQSGMAPVEPPPPPPDEIRVAWQLWLAATVFALVGMLINAATARFGDLPPATRDAIRDAVDSAATDGLTVEVLFTAAVIMGAVFALLAAAVTTWLAFRLRAGKGWARTMLDLVAIFLVVDAVSVVVGVFGGVAVGGERGDVISFVVISFQILAGLCAGTAVWRQHTGEAMKYTTNDRGRSAAE